MGTLGKMSQAWDGNTCENELGMGWEHMENELGMRWEHLEK